MLNQIKPEYIPPLITVVGTIGGIIIGYIFSAITSQVKYSNERKIALKDLLAELLRMYEVLYESLFFMKHDFLSEYLNKYISFLKVNYNIELTASDFPEQTISLLKASFTEELNMLKVEFGEKDWDVFTNSLINIKKYYPLLYWDINREKTSLNFFKKVIPQINDRYTAYVNSIGQNYQNLTLNNTEFNEMSIKNLNLILVIFKTLIKQVSIKTGLFSHLKTCHSLSIYEKLKSKGFNFDNYEVHWKYSVEKALKTELK